MELHLLLKSMVHLRAAFCPLLKVHPALCRPRDVHSIRLQSPRRPEAFLSPISRQSPSIRPQRRTSRSETLHTRLTSVRIRSKQGHQIVVQAHPQPRGLKAVLIRWRGSWKSSRSRSKTLAVGDVIRSSDRRKMRAGPHNTPLARVWQNPLLPQRLLRHCLYLRQPRAHKRPFAIIAILRKSWSERILLSRDLIRRIHPRRRL